MGGCPFGRAKADRVGADVWESDRFSFGDSEKESECDEGGGVGLRLNGCGEVGEEARGEEVDEKPLPAGSGSNANESGDAFPMVG